MSCCHLSRRELLRWSAICSSTALLPIVDPERTFAASSAAVAAAGAFVAMNLELVTLTETSVVLTWYTASPTGASISGQLPAYPAGTTVLMGTSPTTLTAVLDRADSTPYHYAEITGLEPGQTYYYVAMSDGMVATPSKAYDANPAGNPATLGSGIESGFTFTTPQPPPGRFLFSITLCNDLHLGETVAGQAGSSPAVGPVPGGTSYPPAFMSPPGEPPYSETMAKAMVEDSRFRDSRYLFAAGDISSEAATYDLNDAKSILDGFGTYNQDYFIGRGNHDRPHADSSCSTSTCTPGKFFRHRRQVRPLPRGLLSRPLGRADVGLA